MMEKLQANLQAVNLSVNSLYVPDFVSMRYLNYGAAVSEASALITPPFVFTVVSTFSNLTTSLSVYLTAQFNFTKSMRWQVEVDLLTGETTVLRADIIYDCGQSLNPAVDLGQVNYLNCSSISLKFWVCSLSEFYIAFSVGIDWSVLQRAKLLMIGNPFCRLKEPLFKELDFICQKNTWQILMD